MGRAMKDSGVEWIGEIPEEWSVSPIKRSFNIFAGATPKTEVSEYWDGDIIWITPADYKTDDKYVCSGRKNLSQAGYNSCGTTMIPTGSLIFSKRAPVGTVAINTKDLCTNQGCLSCVPKNSANMTFYYYVMSIATEQFELVSSGTTFKEISADSFANFVLPEPSVFTQNIIAEYLDFQCAKINAVIEKTRTSIEEYKYLKQAVITQAVTKGIRGDRPMKNSGIEWIGEIADNYCVHKLKFLLKQSLQYGANEVGVPFEETLPRYIRITDITLNGRLKETGKQSLSEDSAKEFLLKDGDILFARSGATVGKTFLYKSSYGRAAYAGYLIRASLDDSVIPDFLFFYTQSLIYEEWKSQIFIQSTIQNIGADRYSLLPVILPPMDEQQEIAAYLDAKCAEIDALITQKERLLTELENYKKSLIYEYVTGKKEVPHEY